MPNHTFYWHDYETWGADPSVDRASQFAGVRTDADLNVIGEPLMIYNRPTPDCVPHPEACLVTGITPQEALEKGVSEREFIAAIHRELAQPGTVGVGYNSIRFDDEVTRYTLYRNFYDPYAREWQNGNARWDLIDVVRLCCALRPEEIEWPIGDNGAVSFKLELLTAANGLSHESAHDALSDVYATIELARILKTRKPKLFDYALELRKKQNVARLLDLNKQKPLLHISSRYPASRFCSALVMPLAMHPVNKNSVIAVDLMADPEPLLELPAAKVAERVFSRAEDLEEGVERIPLKEIHLNRSPMLATLNLLDAAAQERLQIDMARCEAHWQQISKVDLRSKLNDIYSQREFAEPSDPERMLYSGGFFSREDRSLMDDVLKSSGSELAQTTFPFSDKRLPELLFRYRARNFPDTLSEEEQAHWREFCHQRVHEAGDGITASECLQRIDALLPEQSPEKQQVLAALADYVKALP
ncbi:exodeoxyribonuclease-1 [Litorivivens lipolytica]|uniref:Exodeoxyribonuclease I n=1 Tax=Litorivivens lipolytica TaxID=1524264 RepID=A0A7W4W5D0_9GAMM|nr:exodeoxyribonuclease I [Litorivivens lipolytica]MBB3047740.1 exodeoxyribonuclease-1 [Litorivivens lipolytica]